LQNPKREGAKMKKNVLKGNAIVYLAKDSGHPKDIHIADIEVEFKPNYYGLTLRFPDGSFRTLWLSQKSRLPKEKAR